MSPGKGRTLGGCMFCHDREQTEDTGQLLKTCDDSVIAHYYCMLYAPQVVTRSPPDLSVLSGFDVGSVLKEINRGEITRCCVCKRNGGIIGCDEQTCKRTYHYLCVSKANGQYVLDEEKEIYRVYCSEHKNKKRPKRKMHVERDKDSDDTESYEDSTNGKTSYQPRTKAKQRKMDGQTHSRRKRKKKMNEHEDAAFSGYSSYFEEQTESIHTPTFSKEASDFSRYASETDDELVPFDGSNITPGKKASKSSDDGIIPSSSCTPHEEIARSSNQCESDSSSEQSDSLLSPLPKLCHAISLSRTWEKENAKDTESTHCVTSEEKKVHVEMYTQFGGSLPLHVQDIPPDNENKNTGDTDMRVDCSSSCMEDASMEEPVTSVSVPKPPGVSQKSILHLPSSSNIPNVVVPEATKSPVLQHTPIVKSTNGYPKAKVNLSTKFCTEQPPSPFVRNKALDLHSALPADVTLSSGAHYTTPSAGISLSNYVKPSVVQNTDISAVGTLGDQPTKPTKSSPVESQPTALITSSKSDAQYNRTYDVKCDSARQHTSSPAGKGTLQSQPGNFPILKCTSVDQRTSFAFEKNTLEEPLSNSSNEKATSVPQSRTIPNLEYMVKTFLKEESQTVEVKQLVSKMKEVVNSASKTISLKTPERRGDNHNGKETPGGSSSSNTVQRPADVEREGTVIIETVRKEGSREYKDCSTQTVVVRPCADESSVEFSTSKNVNLLVQYKTIKSQIFNPGASGIGNGVYEQFWNLCRQNNCLEFLLANISTSMKIIAKKIDSGQAKQQDYEQAFTFLLGSRCLEDMVAKTTQEMQERIESIEKEKEELTSKIMFLKDLSP